MVTLLAKIFIQEKNDQAKIREEYGVLCGDSTVRPHCCL